MNASIFCKTVVSWTCTQFILILFMKIRNTLHLNDEIQEFCSDNYKIKKKINFTVVIYLQN